MRQRIVNCPDIELKHLEYESRREELSHEKKYLYERPFLLFLGLITLEFLHESKITLFLPALLTLAFTFSYLYFVSRMLVMARIVAYLQVVHEQNYLGIFIGWESYLDFQRKIFDDISHLRKGEPRKEQKLFAQNILRLHMIPMVLAYFIYYYEAFQKHTYQLNEVIIAITSNAILLLATFVIYIRNKKMPSDIAKYISTETQTTFLIIDKLAKLIEPSSKNNKLAS
jgi:hypothetical protein